MENSWPKKKKKKSLPTRVKSLRRDYEQRKETRNAGKRTRKPGPPGAAEPPKAAAECERPGRTCAGSVAGRAALPEPPLALRRGPARLALSLSRGARLIHSAPGTGGPKEGRLRGGAASPGAPTPRPGHAAMPAGPGIEKRPPRPEPAPQPRPPPGTGLPVPRLPQPPGAILPRPPGPGVRLSAAAGSLPGAPSSPPPPRPDPSPRCLPPSGRLGGCRG